MVNSEPIDNGGGDGGSTELPNTLTISGVGRTPKAYTFTITGTAEKGPNASTVETSPDTAKDGEISGEVTDGTDDYRFDGEVQDLLLYTEADQPAEELVTITINGTSVTPVEETNGETSDQPPRETGTVPTEQTTSRDTDEQKRSAASGSGLLSFVPGILPGIGPLSSSATTALAIVIALALLGTLAG